MRRPEVEEYLITAASHIPGRRVRAEVREEMRGHLEDHAERLMQYGLTEETAWQRAIEEMGAPEELAEQLGEVHARSPLVKVKRASNRLVGGLLWLCLCSYSTFQGSLRLEPALLVLILGLLPFRRCQKRLRVALWLLPAILALLLIDKVGLTLPIPHIWAHFTLPLQGLTHLLCIVFVYLLCNGVADMLPHKDMDTLRCGGWLYAVLCLLTWVGLFLEGIYVLLLSLVTLVLSWILFAWLHSAAKFLYEGEETEVPAEFRPLPRKVYIGWVALVLAVIFLPVGSGWLVKTQPPHTQGYTAEAGDETVREHLLTLGFPARVLAILPREDLLACETAATVDVFTQKGERLPVELTSVYVRTAEGDTHLVAYYEWLETPVENTRCQFSLNPVWEDSIDAARLLLLYEEEGETRRIQPFYTADPALGAEFAVLKGKEGQRGLITADLPHPKPGDTDIDADIRFACQGSAFRTEFQYIGLTEHLGPYYWPVGDPCRVWNIENIVHQPLFEKGG